MRWRWLICCAVAFSLQSCVPDVVYDEYRSAPLAGWERNDTLSFDIPRLTRDGVYDMEMGLRVTGDYPFMALTLVVEQTVLPKGNIARDTIDCQLFDRQGRHLGGGISYFQYTFPVKSMRLKAGDSLRVTIYHDMKKEILPGVSDVGISLRKS